MQPTRLGSILTSRTLSWPGKLRLLGEICVAPRRLASDAATDDESLESFAVRRLGREAFDKLVEPIVSGIFTADPRTLSMAATMPQFLQMERTSGGLIRGYLAAKRQDATAAARRASGARYDQFLAPRDGMSSWIEGLASHLPPGSVRLGASVDGLNLVEAPAGGAPRWQLLSAGRMEPFDGVVLSTPAAVTARLLATVAPTAAQIVRDIPYASSVVVAMVVNRADLAARLDGFGLVVPSRERRAALAISYSSNKYPGRVPDDQILLRIFQGGALRPEVIDQSDAWLEQTAHAELRDLLGWRASKPRWQAVIRWRRCPSIWLAMSPACNNCSTSWPACRRSGCAARPTAWASHSASVAPSGGQSVAKFAGGVRMQSAEVPAVVWGGPATCGVGGNQRRPLLHKYFQRLQAILLQLNDGHQRPDSSMAAQVCCRGSSEFIKWVGGTIVRPCRKQQQWHRPATAAPARTLSPMASRRR